MPTDSDYLNAFVAIRRGEAERLEALLDAHPDLSELAPCRARARAHATSCRHRLARLFPERAAHRRDPPPGGAHVDARGEDGTGETPLHWTASSDDAAVARVLIAAGADIEAPDGSIAR